MSRSAVLDAILTEPRLIEAGFDDTNVKPNYDGAQRPSDKMFMVLRWEENNTGLEGDDGQVQRGSRHLAIWVHMYREFSTDFVRIDDVLNILDDVLASIVGVTGADGRSVTIVEPESRSRDLKDESYQTYCRSATYKIVGTG